MLTQSAQDSWGWIFRGTKHFPHKGHKAEDGKMVLMRDYMRNGEYRLSRVLAYTGRESEEQRSWLLRVSFFFCSLCFCCRRWPGARVSKGTLVFEMQQTVINSTTHDAWHFTNETWRMQATCQRCLERGEDLNFTGVNFFFQNGTAIQGCPAAYSFLLVAGAKPLSSCISASGNYTVFGYAPG